MFENLNLGQKKAIAHDKGPCMVIAGPGAGKTSVITKRIIRLVREKIAAPYQILALTFTKKAAQEMQKRIAQQLGPEESRKLWIGTFHSIFSRILRIESNKMGITQNFTIYDSTDSKNLLKGIIGELKLDPKIYISDRILWRISQAKKKGLNAAEYAQESEWIAEDQSNRVPKIQVVFQHYQARCQRAEALDFDDILYYTHRLFEKNSEVLTHYQKHFAQVLVDEFQDTNALQYAIVEQLTSGHENLFVVGDDAQSIYAFQGADIGHMLNFKKKYPNSSLIKLEQNYRSTGNILRLANALIKHNRQHPKVLFTQNEDGDLPQLSAAYNEQEEARLVVQDIFMHRQQYQRPYSDFAIIYRTNRQSRLFEEALRKFNMPYRVIGGISFYQRKEIKDLIAYLRVLINPNDEQAIERAINIPKRGIGNVTLQSMYDYSAEQKSSLWESLKKATQWAKPQIAKALANFVQLIESHQAALLKKEAHKVARSIFEKSGLKNILAQEHLANTEKGFGTNSREEYVEELISAMQNFEKENEENNSLAVFLQEIALFFENTEEEKDEEKVVLITAHKSKGLEWSQVYAVGMNEEVFPSWHMLQSQKDIEEERRLFFVVLSRAQKRLNITYPMHRFLQGRLIPTLPSRFLNELDQKALKLNTAQENLPKKEKNYTQRSKLDSREITSKNSKSIGTGSTRPLYALPHRNRETDLPKLTLGTKVKHPKFGIGYVKRLDTEGPYPKVEVSFTEYGTKILLIQYARLSIIDKSDE